MRTFASPLFVAALLPLTACADRTTAPAAPPVPAVPEAYISNESIPFPSGAVDTTRLVDWVAAVTGGTMGSQYEWRARGHNARGDVVTGRSVYTVRNGPYYGSLNTENAPLMAFRPHENTAEFVEVEAYLTGCSLDCRIGNSGFVWYSKDNGATAVYRTWSDMYGNSGVDVAAKMGWTSVSYPIDLVQVVPSATTVLAGNNAVLYAQAFAPDHDTEIFNQPTTWTSNNASVGTLRNGSSGVPLTRFTDPRVQWLGESYDTLATTGAGIVTVSATIGGKTASQSITVTPRVNFTGPNPLVSGTVATYTSTVSGCNTTCTYQWDMLYTDYGGVTRDMLLGTASTQRLSAPDASSFELTLTVTSNGVTGSFQRQINVSTSTGCTSRTGC